MEQELTLRIQDLIINSMDNFEKLLKSRIDTLELLSSSISLLVQDQRIIVASQVERIAQLECVFEV